MKTEAEPALTFWVVMYDPSDYPGKFVVRAQDVIPGREDPVARPECATFDTLEEARQAVPDWTIRLERSPEDPPHVIESWL